MSVIQPPKGGPKAIEDTPIVAVIAKIIGICFLSNNRYIQENIIGIKAPPVKPCIALKATTR